MFGLAVSLSACNGIRIENTTVCTVAGKLSAGMICAETLTPKTGDLSFEQAVEFLEPQFERPDPAQPGKVLPARAGALCQSSADWNKMKTALEQACEKMGDNCSKDIRTDLKSFSAKTAGLNAQSQIKRNALRH